MNTTGLCSIVFSSTSEVLIKKKQKKKQQYFFVQLNKNAALQLFFSFCSAKRVRAANKK
jgi:hypothetical protein